MAGDQFVSRRAHAVDASGIRKMFDLSATLKDPVNFSIGQPDYDVPENVKRAAIQAIRDGKNGYTPTQGIAPLVEKIRHRLYAEFPGARPAVFVTSGISGGLTTRPFTGRHWPAASLYSTSSDVNHPPISSTAPVW